MYSFKYNNSMHQYSLNAQTVQTVQTVIVEKKYSHMIPISTIILVYILLVTFNDYYNMYSFYNIPDLIKLMHENTVYQTVRTVKTF